MQYVAKAGGFVYNQWNSLNPSTLSGAIDVIVIEQEDGTFHCSPWHVRFGKFQIFKPSHKKIDLYVNDRKTDLPMKLGEGGEAFFVFETDNADLLSKSVLTSPVVLPVELPLGLPSESPTTLDLGEPEKLDLTTNESDNIHVNSRLEQNSQLSEMSSKLEVAQESSSALNQVDFSSTDQNYGDEGRTRNSQGDSDLDDKASLRNVSIKSNTNEAEINDISVKAELSNTSLSLNAFEKARRITEKLNIPSKIDINGDMVLDMDGYKPTSQKNIENSDEIFQKIFFDEIKNMDSSDIGEDGLNIWNKLIVRDDDGTVRILNSKLDHGLNLEDEDIHDSSNLQIIEDHDNDSVESDNKESVVESETGEKAHFKTLRLTSDQLKQMKLNYGYNELIFKSSEGNSQIYSSLYLWKANIPIVISDIDGTITKSDAMGHLLNLIGRDWTHPGVAKLFQNIAANGYNIMYLTARSVGQSDSTRQYLKTISQDGTKLPPGPVILSPDRTFAALRREIVLKQPEVFKMACLNDIKSLYFNNRFLDPKTEDDRTPFYAGFGNRITDAISYRSVKIPSHRIFTINPDGEVHMELLELTGHRSTYLGIGEIVDLFFPPLPEVSHFTADYNKDQFENYINTQENFTSSPRSPDFMPIAIDEKYTDVNFWKESLNFSDLTDLEDEDINLNTVPSSPKTPKSPKSPKVEDLESISAKEGNMKLKNIKKLDLEEESPKKSRPSSMASFATPLKSFMKFGHRRADENEDDDDKDYEKDANSNNNNNNNNKLKSNYQQSGFVMPGSFNRDIEVDEDDFTGDEEEEDEDYEDDYEDTLEDEEAEDDFEDEDDDYDDDGLDEDEELHETLADKDVVDPVAKFVKASELDKLKITE